jgi:hypothetical protein
MTGAIMSPSLVRENREFAAELKFVVPSAVAEQIRSWSRANLSSDPYGSGEHRDLYRIHSIYFDTEGFDVYHRRGSYGRSKFRIRRYGEAETIFLERKLRTNSMLTKRRSTATLPELERLREAQLNEFWAGAWYHRRLLLRRLRPVCQITYERTARVFLSAHGPVRLTLDEKVCACPAAGLCFVQPPENKLLLQNEVIVELKYRVEVPPLFKGLMAEFAMPPAKISKYRLAARELGLVQEPVPELVQATPEPVARP